MPIAKCEAKSGDCGFIDFWARRPLNASVRQLVQPEVLKSASLAAAATSLLCWPRLLLWPGRPYPVWYLEAVLFLGGIVLWAFVFAWHASYSGHSVFPSKIPPRPFALATLAAVLIAAVLSVWLDPVLRLENTADYPRDLTEWISMTLFNLAFSQLFLVFAPFAWLVRLFRNTSLAAALTVSFSLIVLASKAHASGTTIPPGLLIGVATVRIVIASFSVYFYLRGGVWLVSWWTLLLHARHLIHMR